LGGLELGTADVAGKRIPQGHQPVISRQAYGPLLNVLNDLVTAVVLLLLLAIPFAYAIERLLVGTPHIYRQIGYFVVFFLITFAVLYTVNPAFRIAATPIVIFLAFAIILLSALVIVIMTRKLESEVRRIQGLGTTVHSSDVSRLGTMMAAVHMGISTMRRRPIRTLLTAVTVVLLTFTILTFASFGFVPKHSFTDPAYLKEEIDLAKKGVDFVAHFPGCRLDMAGGSSPTRDNLDEKFETMCRVYNEVGALADKKNVPVDFHPHSHAGSIIETAEEYARVMECTDASIIGWCPDSGHIVRGGLDFIDTITRYRDRIRNFHFKDVDLRGKWKLMGHGVCDYQKALALLEDMRYDGWVIAEEESDEARADQKAAVTENRLYLESLGY